LWRMSYATRMREKAFVICGLDMAVLYSLRQVHRVHDVRGGDCRRQMECKTAGTVCSWRGADGDGDPCRGKTATSRTFMGSSHGRVCLFHPTSRFRVSFPCVFSLFVRPISSALSLLPSSRPPLCRTLLISFPSSSAFYIASSHSPDRPLLLWLVPSPSPRTAVSPRTMTPSTPSFAHRLTSHPPSAKCASSRNSKRSKSVMLLTSSSVWSAQSSRGTDRM
jgi:hypothetical protein